jgi:hypothetical protein
MIAESNRPVFSSTAGTEWWLADHSAGAEQNESIIEPISAEISNPPTGESIHSTLKAFETLVNTTICSSAVPDVTPKQPAVPADHSRSSEREELAWDPKQCCFVHAAC